MSEDKRGFFRRSAKKDGETLHVDISPVEVVVDDPTLTVSPEPLLIFQDVDVLTASEPTSSLLLQNESPIEAKIHALVEAATPVVEGWNNDVSSAPIDGQRIMISENGKDKGQLVYWRISKFVDKKNLRYVSKGRWTDFLTKIDITFVPKYWKAYSPEEYWPLQGIKA